MTLAGTRPILQDELQKYELHHRARIAIKPGITGMWQVSGRSDITDFEEVVRLDTEYISNWNFGLDMLNSAFYTVYGIMHYTWLSVGYLFVEVGYLGTIAYLSFFVILEIRAIVAYQKRSIYYNLLGTFFPIVFMIIIVYNSTLRSNFAYIVFAVLTWQALADDKKGENSCDSKIY